MSSMVHPQQHSQQQPHTEDEQDDTAHTVYWPHTPPYTSYKHTKRNINTPPPPPFWSRSRQRPSLLPFSPTSPTLPLLKCPSSSLVPLLISLHRGDTIHVISISPLIYLVSPVSTAATTATTGAGGGATVKKMSPKSGESVERLHYYLGSCTTASSSSSCHHHWTLSSLPLPPIREHVAAAPSARTAPLSGTFTKRQQQQQQYLPNKPTATTKMVTAAFDLDEHVDFEDDDDQNDNSNDSMTTLFSEPGEPKPTIRESRYDEGEENYSLGFEMTREDFNMNHHDDSSSSSFMMQKCASPSTTSQPVPVPVPVPVVPSTKMIDRIKNRLTTLSSSVLVTLPSCWTKTANEMSPPHDGGHDNDNDNDDESIPSNVVEGSQSSLPSSTTAASPLDHQQQQTTTKSHHRLAALVHGHYQATVSVWKSKVNKNMRSNAATDDPATITGNGLDDPTAAPITTSPQSSANATTTPTSDAAALAGTIESSIGSNSVRTRSTSSDSSVSPVSSPNRVAVGGVDVVEPLSPGVRNQKSTMSTLRALISNTRTSITNNRSSSSINSSRLRDGNRRRPQQQQRRRLSEANQSFGAQERQQQRLPALLVLAGWKNSSNNCRSDDSSRRVPALLVLAGWKSSNYCSDDNTKNNIEKKSTFSLFSARRNATKIESRIILDHDEENDDSLSIDTVLFEREESSSGVVTPKTTAATPTLGTTTTTTTSIPDSLFAAQTTPQTRTDEPNKLPALLILAGWGRSGSHPSSTSATSLQHKQNTSNDDDQSVVADDEITALPKQEKKIFMSFNEWMETVKATLGQNGKRDTIPFQQDKASSPATLREKLTFSLDPILRHMNWKRQNDRAFVSLESHKPTTALSSTCRQAANVTSIHRPPPCRMNRKPRQRLPAAARRQNRPTSTPRRSTALAAMPTILENDEVSLESV